MRAVNALKIRNPPGEALNLLYKNGESVLASEIKEKRLGKKNSTSVLRELRGIFTGINKCCPRKKSILVFLSFPRI